VLFLGLLTKMGDFYVLLSSDVKTEDYPKNTISKFTTPLPENIKIGSNYEVGLCSFFYEHDWDNLFWPLTIIVFKKIVTSSSENEGSNKTYVVYLPDGYYKSVEEFCLKVNSLKPEFFSGKLETDKVSGKVVIRLEKGESIIFNEKLSGLLGFDRNEFDYDDTLGEISSRRTPNLDGALKTLFIYSNLVEYSIVGNTLVPLLREVKIDGQGGDHVEKSWAIPHYIPLISSNFKTIEIDIRDELGDSMKFNAGHVLVKLHFRKRKRDIF